MAVLFRIDATPGPSTFGSQADFYFDKGDGDTDALYPAIYVADALDVVGGKFALDTASPSDWQTCGMWLNPLGSLPGGGSGGWAANHFLDLNGPCYMEAVFHPNTTSIADNFYAPLIWLSTPLGGLSFGVFVYGGDSGANAGLLEVYRLLDGAGSGYFSELNPDFSAPSGTRYVDGDPYTVRMEWQCGTVDESFDVASNGWWKLIINDIEVTGQTDVPLYLNMSTIVEPSDTNRVGWAAVGFDGTLGPWDYFEIGSIDQQIQSVIIGRGAAADDKAKVTSDLTVLMNLDGVGRTVHEPGTLYVAGKLIVTDTVTLGASSMGLDALSDVALTSPANLDVLAYNGSAWVNSAPVVRYAEVAISSAELLALRATPKTLVAAPGAGKVLKFLGATLLLDATATAYVESAANLGIKYTNGSGAQVSETIEATGFIDQTTDTQTEARPKLDPIVAKSGCENQALVLHNLGAGEYTTGTGTMRVKVLYAVWTTGW